MRAHCLTLLLMAQPVLAQDFSYDPAVLTACLSAQKDQPDSCIGKASGLCMEGEGGSSTVGMVSCLGAEADQWDEHLNAAYETVLAESERTDAEMKQLGSAADPEVPALHEMQRSWIAFRDAAFGEAAESIVVRPVVAGRHRRRDRLQLANVAASERRAAQCPLGELLVDRIFEQLHSAHATTFLLFISSASR